MKLVVWFIYVRFIFGLKKGFLWLCDDCNNSEFLFIGYIFWSIDFWEKLNCICV